MSVFPAWQIALDAVVHGAPARILRQAQDPTSR
jgi:hypothetical protein